MSFARFATLLLCLAPATAGEPPSMMNAFRDGESLTFRVGWGLFPHAGEIVIDARTETPRDLPQLQVSTMIATKGLVRTFFPYDNLAGSIIDFRTGRLLAASEDGALSRHPSRSMIAFDYEKRTAMFRDYVRPERSRSLAIPEGDPLDLISSLVQARAWNLRPGEKTPALVHFYDDFYPLVIYADHFEKITTPLGTFEALVLIPRMEKEPKGMFKHGGGIKVWISQDGRHLPVQMAVKLKIGLVRAVLTDYQPPAARSYADARF